MDEMNDTHQTAPESINFGLRLKTAREALRLSEKEAATRLHLNTKLIRLMESDPLKHDLPPTFMRGYLRSYGRLLNFSESEINNAIEKLNLNPPPQTLPLAQPAIQKKENEPKLDHYLRWSSYAISSLLFILVLVWWSSHPRFNQAEVITKQLSDAQTTTDATTTPVNSDGPQPATTTLASASTTTSIGPTPAETPKPHTQSSAKHSDDSTAENSDDQSDDDDTTTTASRSKANSTHASNNTEPDLDSVDQENIY